MEKKETHNSAFIDFKECPRDFHFLDQTRLSSGLDSAHVDNAVFLFFHASQCHMFCGIR